MKRTLTLLLTIVACVATLDTAAQATGQRMHKPYVARVTGYEPPDPCISPVYARCTGIHHLGNGSGSGKLQ
jgi:hypothetical protein